MTDTLAAVARRLRVADAVSRADLRREVLVWRFDADRLGLDVGAALSADERARAAAYRVPGAGEVFTAVRGTLRVILGTVVGVAPGSVHLTVGPDGRPELDDRAVWFSVSHTGSRAAIAVTAAGPVGIDIEDDRPLPDVADLARRACTAAERRAVGRDPDPAAAFRRLWCRKEAVLKAVGRGLAHAPHLVEVLDSWVPGEALGGLVVTGPRAGVEVRDLDVPGAIAVLCASPIGFDVRCIVTGGARTSTLNDISTETWE